MALQTSGQISSSDVNLELGRASNDPFDMNGTEERSLAGVPSSTISMSDFYGKSSLITITHTQNADIDSVSIHDIMGSPTMVANYVFVNNAIITRTDSTTNAGISTGVFPSGSTLTIVNKSYFRGAGGDGGDVEVGAQYLGEPGAPALKLEMDVTIDNSSGYFYGGGGGGGSDRITSYGSKGSSAGFGGGGGGGAGINGGSGGTSNGTTAETTNSTDGTASTGGNGGSATSNSGSAESNSVNRNGGDGGNPGQPGNSGNNAGGAAGRAIYLNGFSANITSGNVPYRLLGGVS